MEKFNVNVNKFISEYDVYAKVIEFKGEKYIVTSLEPISDIDYKTIRDIILRNNRNTFLFYPKISAVKIDENNYISALDAVIDYCREAEFIKTVYAEYGLPVPLCIRREELSALMRFNVGRSNIEFDINLRTLYEKGLTKFFKRERRGGLHKMWRDFIRSEKMDIDASRIKNIWLFFKRKNPETDLHLLLQSGENVKILEMQEHEFKEFKKIVRKYYPDFKYNSGKKYKVNHGMVDKAGNKGSPWGKTITNEEFSRNRDKYIYGDEKYRISYWEFRNVVYRAADEPIIAEIYNNLSTKNIGGAENLQNLQVLKNRGELEFINIPEIYFTNFARLATEKNLLFYADVQGEYTTPSLKSVCIVFNKYNSELANDILRTMMNDKLYHSVSTQQKMSLKEQISMADTVVKPEKFNNKRRKEMLL